jgi:adenylylsulfate kinase-like enzyme
MVTNKPTIFWLTGLSGSGKSTLGSWLTAELNINNCKSILLDGDDLRHIYADMSTDRSSRLKIGYRNFRLCEYLVRQECNVILAAVGMRTELFSYFKAMSACTCLVYLDVPLTELVRRDPKGIYKKFFSGLISNVSGLDSIVDMPQADVLIKWKEGLSIAESKDCFSKSLLQSGFISL